MTNTPDSAAQMLETCALGFAATVRDPDAISDGILDAHPALLRGSREALRASALAYASSCGNLDAAERAELLTLRRLRAGVDGLRKELDAGLTETGERMDRKIAIVTIDALLALA